MTEQAQQFAPALERRVEEWVAQARQKPGGISEEDMQGLLALVRRGRPRQRLLYLHAGSPSIYAPLVGVALHEPVAGARTQIDPLAPDLPYGCVHDALCEGWRVVHFPLQTAPFEDREIDIMGYEFILERMEEWDG
ncbi:MAG: hypothetical protein FJY95_17625 [Candidatus Handelsmanbacteria bacterium]|nr:hypothetical protein [Candidatus Handelsmanbacteria bacterium]